MSIFKCKMCGGSLEIVEESKICTCEFCGTEQTLPSVRDENIQGLFNRATVLRMKSEFDKASEIYEKIIHSNQEEAEAYWGLILCKYGIEYVEDPVTYKRIPTCHRASYDAVVSDDDYKNALQYADITQRSIYEEQAKQIDEIQKGIIALAQQADPYDVFICYKETDENGNRTQDSVIANDIYYQLTQEGYKVFYAAITLEDKLGAEYEPYIFSALNTSKVMLSIGTKPEYFQAVWVKNEWSRFLKIMKKDRNRLLIPCYRDMDAYELPEEFAHLQAQNMAKIGFINDLVRGIKKVIVKETEKTPETVVVQSQQVYNSNVTALLKRGNMALEDGEWEKADGFFEEVLNQDAECAESYLGKYMAQEHASDTSVLKNRLKSKYFNATSQEHLTACDEATDRINKAVSDYVLSGYLEEATIRAEYKYDRTFTSVVACRKEQKKNQLEELEYDKQLTKAGKYAKGKTKEDIDSVFECVKAALDQRISEAEQADKEQVDKITKDYSDFLNKADAKVKELRADADERKEDYYQSLIRQKNNAKTISDYENVKSKLIALSDYMEASKHAVDCTNEIKKLQLEQQQREEAERVAREKEARRIAKKKKIITISAVSIIAVAIAFAIVITQVIIPKRKLTAIKNAKVGEIVKFGNYNGNTDWIVLDREDDRVLIISKDAIEYREYNEKDESVTWENCTLRKWLNETYINKAFSKVEAETIMTTDVSNPNNSKYGTKGGNDTEDKIFLLSIDEAKKYFSSDSNRKATLKYGLSCFWWLRSPGDNDISAAGVYDDGSVSERGYFVSSDDGAVRPALWVDISNL